MGQLYFPEVVEPVVRDVYLSGSVLPGFSVDITGDEYAAAVQHSKNMCSDRRSTWKSVAASRGFSNTARDPYAAERVGSLGELAFAKLFGLGVQFYFKRGGEISDFLVAGAISVDVKLRNKKWEFAIIRATDDYGHLVKLMSEFYVCGYLAYDNQLESKATVVFLGFAHREQVLEWNIQKAFRGSHSNYQALFASMNPFEKLYCILTSRVSPFGVVR